jgi:DNA ligase D
VVVADDGAIEVDVDGRAVRVTSPHKVFFSKREETKLDLINFYLSIAEPFMSAVGGRPTLMQRFPDGASGKSFFQKRVPKGAPEWLETTTVSTVNGTESNALVLADMAHVVWAVNLGCLGFHPWPYQAANPNVACELRIDLDPSPGVSFEQVRQGAGRVHELLTELGITSYPKTSASKGLHVYVPLLPQWTSTEVRSAAVALARELERRHDSLLTAAWWKEERGTRVFVDFNQNAPHKTVFGAWSVRARVGAQVSTPFAWDELDDIRPDEFTMASVGQRVADNGDPWATYRSSPQSLDALMEMHTVDMDNGLMDAPWPPQYPKAPNEPPRVAPSRAKKSPE